ncbi:LPD5 domain-containing protein [Rheinheimera sp. MMS21-TC3]|uniref:LPD5 domain-containing protein n=1 Tax=Rheinheimera sp. MMS21-TC3 TaxID=3072790 RepID=UPI00391F9162
MTSDGQWNKTFKDRVQNAIFAKGYDDTDLLSSISESTNPDSKNLLAALMNVAGKLGSIRAMDADIGKNLSSAFTQAASLFAKAKRDGTTVKAIDAQADMLTGHTDADIVALATALESATRSGKRMTALLNDIVSTVLTDTQNMGQTDIFTGKPGARPNPNEVIRNATEQQQQTDTTGATGLFDGTQDRQADTTEQPSIQQDTESSESESRPSEVSPQAETTNQTPADAGVSVSESEQIESAEQSAPIEDFGEKLGGARKDVWGGFADAVTDEINTRELPLSKAFPEPDYVKMAADGVPMETLAIIAAMRAEIPAKPRVAYKVNRWAENVDIFRDFASQLVNGEVTPQEAIKAMKLKGNPLNEIADAIPAIAKANPEQLKLAAKYRVGSGSFGIFRGVTYSPNKVFYFPKLGNTEMLSIASENKQDALDNLESLIAKEAEVNPTGAAIKKSKISVYSDRYTKQVYLGWKGSSGVLRIQEFDSIQAARDHLKNNRDDVEAKLKQIKETPSMRRPENQDRIGPERFAGNVTPSIFADTFGFRGIEFGNWVEQGRRQKDLNEAYDALMDLSDVLGVPPKALALNGELGMAFGARGTGGKRGFKAHYEPDYVAINLTKGQGAGSLAHEWWHATDNYFSRMAGKPTRYLTEGSGVRGGDLRPEVRMAFDELMTAIKKTDVIDRAANLDKRRSKSYWSTNVEASARSFEAFIIDELAKKDFNNDYLANILEAEAWDALESMNGNLPNQTYPYPTKAEQETINPAFRKLFETLQVKETDKGTMLFSKANYDKMRNQKAKGVPAAQIERMVSQFMKKLNGASGIKVKVLRNQSEAELAFNMSLSGSIVRGAYDDKTKTAFLIAENFENLEHAKRTLAHEVIAHGGLQSVIGVATYNQFLQRVNSTRTKASFRGRWSGIMNDYGDLTPEKQAEEFFARFVEDQPDNGSLKYWWQSMLRWLNNQLAKVGITRAGDPDIAAMTNMVDSIVQGFKSGKAPRRQVGKAVAFDQQSQTNTEAFKKWFGDSKVVDENGDPKAVYHNTNSEFSTFKAGERSGLSGKGIYFSDSPLPQFGKRQIKAYLKIENPITRKTELPGMREINSSGMPTKFIDDIFEKFPEFDGIINRSEIVVKHPSQIKSATNNNGDFDPDNPDIMFSRTANPTADQDTSLADRIAKAVKPKDRFAKSKKPEWEALNAKLRESDKTLGSKIKKELSRWIMPGGNMPEVVKQAVRGRDRDVTVHEFDISMLVGKLDEAIKAGGVNPNKLTDAQWEKYHSFITGQDSVTGLSDAERNALILMRQHIDGLTQDYVGAVTNKLQQRLEQDGKDDPAEMARLEKMIGNIGKYLNRSYKAFDDKEWFKKIPTDVIDNARDYLINQYTQSGDSQAEAARKAEVTINEIVKTGTAYDSLGAFISESKLGSKDLSTLIQRKDISPEIRALLGEYRDPRINYAKSVSKMSAMIANDKLLSTIRDMGMGSFLFEKDNRPPEATVQLAGESSDTYAPLNGVWTTPEIKQAFEDAMGGKKGEGWLETAIRVNGFIKYGKTVLSPTTAMRNVMSSYFFTVANGHFNQKYMKQAVAAFNAQVKGKVTDGESDYMKRLIKLGVIYDSANAGEMVRMMTDGKVSEWLEGKSGAAFDGLRWVTNKATGFYRFGDDFWKIVGFENEKAALIRAGMAEPEAEAMAAERIQDTYPTYSRVGKAGVRLSRFPLVGTFVSFPAEIIRTTGNLIKLAASEIKSDNPEIRAMGARRIVGITLSSGGMFALSALSAAMFGVDDDDEEALRDMTADWQKNSTFIYAGRDKDGNLRYFDMSFIDPYGYWKRPIEAMMRDQPVDKAIASSMRDMLSPFFGVDISAGKIFEVLSNKKESGGKVFKENDSVLRKSSDIAKHVALGLAPGAANNAWRIAMAAGDVKRSTGKPYSMSDEMLALMGFRSSTFDPKVSLYYRTFDFNSSVAEARQELSGVLRDPNKVSDNDIAAAKKRAERKQEAAFKEMTRLVSAAQTGGSSRAEVIQILRLAGISQTNVGYLMSGRVPPVNLSDTSFDSAVKRAQLIMNDEAAKEVRSRFSRIVKQ